VRGHLENYDPRIELAELADYSQQRLLENDFAVKKPKSPGGVKPVQQLQCDKLRLLKIALSEKRSVLR
jgi:hypothetical protein